MTNQAIDYLLLVKATSKDEGCKQVLHFLNTTELISYDRFDIHDVGCMDANHQQFWPAMATAMEKNRLFSAMLLEELKGTGVATVEDLLQLSPGYPSKLLHILAHMLDGFISIDSALYNLVEDSHQVSTSLEKTIHTSPEKYWLIPVITGVLENSLLHPMPKKIVPN